MAVKALSAYATVTVQALVATSGQFSSDISCATTAQFTAGGATSFIGQTATPGAIINGSQAGDLLVRAGTKRIVFSSDSGGTSALVIAANSAITMSNGLTVSANGITVVAGNSSFAGVLSVGTTVASGALAGDIVMPLTRGLRSVNVAGTGTVTLIYAGTSGGVLVTAIDANSNALYIDNASTATSASAGAASALPATPAGYLIVNIAGTNRKLPYYAT